MGPVWTSAYRDQTSKRHPREDDPLPAHAKGGTSWLVVIQKLWARSACHVPFALLCSLLVIGGCGLRLAYGEGNLKDARALETTFDESEHLKVTEFRDQSRCQKHRLSARCVFTYRLPVDVQPF